MAKVIILVLSCAGVLAAPPQHEQRAYQHGPAQIQQLNALDYYLDNPDVAQYYSQQQNDKQAQVNSQSGAPSRLETLEPDSEVELLPGAQQPQQPPQQNPVAPNLPGLIPGQRVYIVHMPVPGYRPGSVGGYQPVYVVAAAPGGNNNYAPNGYQNTLLVDPSGQGLVSPLLGYPGVIGQGNPSYLIAGGPLALNRPYNLQFQDPRFVYRQNLGGQSNLPNGPGQVRLAQLISLQANPEQAAAANVRKLAKEPAANTHSSRLTESNESKEALQQKRNARPAPAQPPTYDN